MKHTPHHNPNAILAVLITLAGILGLAFPAVGIAAGPPIKEILVSHIVGGFERAISVGGGESNIYVLDSSNHRVQEFSHTGEFIAMYGWNVNQTKEKEGAPQAERNICTKESGDTCQVGTAGTNPGQLASSPESIAVDPANDHYYVAEITFGSIGGHLVFGQRVQEFTANGEFVMEIGKEANETTKGNLCTQKEVEESIAKCKGPLLETPEEFASSSTEPGAFKFAQEPGNLLAAGGPEGLLYVGDRNGIQEFRADGTSNGEPVTKSKAISQRLSEISSELNRHVTKIAVDKDGNIFIGYQADTPPTTVYEFDQLGQQISQFSTDKTNIIGLAVDPSGRLAVIGNDAGELRGLFYEIGEGKLRLLTEFVNDNARSITFNDDDELYAAKGSEVDAYKPVSVAELAVGNGECVEGLVFETSVTLNCTLKGTVTPWGVSETEAWFQWGETEKLGNETPPQPVPLGSTSVPVSATVEGVRPTTHLYYRVAAHDQNVKAPELLTSEVKNFQTQSVPPRVVGGLSVSFVKSSTAVLSGLLNPENANTQYQFEYGACLENRPETCASSPYTGRTESRASAAYSRIRAILEATELQPATLYHYRLTATNAGGSARNEIGGADLPEGTFTTSPTPVPEAITGPVFNIDTTTATILGTVNAKGQPSIYTFEIGTAQTTQYTPVFTGSTASTEPTAQAFTLTGLQPGTHYIYRITVKNGLGQAAGAAREFTTQSVSYLAPPPQVSMLEVPKIVFPCKFGYTRDKYGKCVRAKRPVKRRKARHRKKRSKK